MSAGFSAAARRQGIKNALVCIAGTFAAVLAASLGIAWVFGRSWGESVLFGLALVVATVYLLLLRSWLRGRRRAGGVLLDCGPTPGRRSSLVSAAWFFASGVALSVLNRSSGGGAGVLGWFFMVQAIPMVLIAFRHVQVREHGLWSGTSLLPWDSIESYWWDGDRTLMLATKADPWAFQRGAFLVPAELHDAVDRLLRTLMPERAFATRSFAAR
jgi:hypothetical protein